ncbi:M56 family metallopeptidase, partial [Lysobacter antibioticus]
MSAVELLRALAETAAAMSLAIALVLALRRPLRRAFGAGVAYAAWWLVPLAVVAVLLPAAPRPPTATAWQV